MVRGFEYDAMISTQMLIQILLRPLPNAMYDVEPQGTWDSGIPTYHSIMRLKEVQRQQHAHSCAALLARASQRVRRYFHENASTIHFPRFHAFGRSI